MSTDQTANLQFDLCIPRAPLLTNRKRVGVVKSLGGFRRGPVGLLHTQKVGIKYKKPTSVVESYKLGTRLI
jgi:hypothetical protein